MIFLASRRKWPRMRVLGCGGEFDFEFKRSMAGINPHTRTYKRATGAVEAVLCFEKS